MDGIRLNLRLSVLKGKVCEETACVCFNWRNCGKFIFLDMEIMKFYK